MKPVEISLSASPVEKKQIDLELSKERYEAAREKLPILTKALRIQDTQKGRTKYRKMIQRLQQKIKKLAQKIRADQTKLRKLKRG